MKKKATKLTFDEQGALIRAAISQTEVNSNKLRETIASCKIQHPACHIENIPNQENKISQYVGTTFNFFGITPLGIPVHVLFTFEKVSSLLPDQAILTGTITYYTDQISNETVVVDLLSGNVKYREIGTRKFQILELDNRFKLLWSDFVNCLKNCDNPTTQS